MKQALSQALNKTPEATRDRAHGPGVRYALGENDALTVELFPPHAERKKGIVRLSTADSLQEFYRQPHPAIREEGLIFETSELLISLSPVGELMTYRLVHDETPEEPAAPPDDEDRTNGPDGDDQGHSGDPRASGRGFQTALPEGKDGQPRVAYGGRLGTDPRTKTTPKGRFVMEFPVAVKVEDQEKPDWRDTVVFDDRARKLEADGTLAKGVYVDVVAYEHAKLRQDRAGKPREVKEYYATSVTPKVRTRQQTEDRDAGARAGSSLMESSRPHRRAPQPWESCVLRSGCSPQLLWGEPSGLNGPSSSRSAV